MTRLLPALSCALLVTWTASALAQGDGGAPPATQDETGSAEQRYESAQQLYLEKRYAEALEIFQQLVDEAHSPNARLYVARCLREMGRLTDAYRQMRRTARESEQRAASEPRFSDTRDAAKRELEELRARVALVTLALAGRPNGLDLEVNGHPVSGSDLDDAIPVIPGPLSIRASAAGFAPFSADRRAEPGQALSIAVALTPLATAEPKPTGPTAPDEPPRQPSAGTPALLIGGVVSLTLGVAGWVMLGVAGTMAGDIHDDVSKACGGTHCPDPSHEDDIDRGALMDILANVGLGVGIVGTVAGGVLIGVHLAQDDGPDTSVSLAPHPGGAAVVVQF